MLNLKIKIPIIYIYYTQAENKIQIINDRYRWTKIFCQYYLSRDLSS